MSPPPAGGEWVTLAVLGRTRGNRGELTAVCLSSKPDRFQQLKEVYLFGDGRPYQVEAAWFHGATLILKFQGVDTISDAEKLTGSEVRVPFAERAPLEAGEFYQSDLVGCQVVDRCSGQPIGQVTAFEESGGSGLLVVGRDLLVPFVRSICVEIDPAARRILVDLPQGLESLNQS